MLKDLSGIKPQTKKEHEMSDGERGLNLLQCNRGELATEEWKILQGKITEWGKQMFVIRGWLITILSGLTVALFTTKVAPHTYYVVGLVLILILMMCELIEAAWQRKAILRAARIEESLRGEKPYDGPLIGESLSASASFADYFSELRKHLISGFYLGLIGLVTIVWGSHHVRAKSSAAEFAVIGNTDAAIAWTWIG